MDCNSRDNWLIQSTNTLFARVTSWKTWLLSTSRKPSFSNIFMLSVLSNLIFAWNSLIPNVSTPVLIDNEYLIDMNKYKGKLIFQFYIYTRTFYEEFTILHHENNWLPASFLSSASCVSYHDFYLGNLRFLRINKKQICVSYHGIWNK